MNIKLKCASFNVSLNILQTIFAMSFVWDLLVFNQLNFVYLSIVNMLINFIVQ